MLNAVSVYRQLNKSDWGEAEKEKKKFRTWNQKVLLLSLAEIEGPSDFTGWEFLLLMSRPWKRPRGSWCCNWSEGTRMCPGESIVCWWLEMPAGRGWNWGICMFSLRPGWGWGVKKAADWLYETCCIAKLNVSELVDISPVASLSLSTSCFSASLSAAILEQQICKYINIDAALWMKRKLNVGSTQCYLPSRNWACCSMACSRSLSSVFSLLSPVVSLCKGKRSIDQEMFGFNYEG